MLSFRQLLGQQGESSAAHFLKSKGYEIIEKNYRCTYGEIDLIVRDNEIIVFVEVKTRSSKAFGGPAAAVNYRKQNQISKVAQHFLVDKKLGDVDARFDVVSIVAKNGKPLQIEHLTDAFEFTIS